jgi:hypothetical protein
MPKSFTIQTVVALFLAAIVPAALFTLGFEIILNSPSNTFLDEAFLFPFFCLLFAFPVALLHLVALGIPAFLLGWKIRRINWQSVLIISFLIGAIPWSLLIGLSSSSASSNSWQAVKEAGIVGTAMGLLGVSGGMTFWFLWRLWITRVNPDLSNPLSDKDS